jgi:hypothetical protein
MSETGFGIGASQHEDVWRVVTVYHDTKFVEITEIDKVWSFDGFITAFANETV